MHLDAIIFDLDGTIACNIEAYKGIDVPKLWCWDTFRERMSRAPVIDGIWDLWHSFVGHGFKIIILTARPEFMRDETIEWLKKNHLTEYHELIMMSEEWFGVQEALEDCTEVDIRKIQAEYKREELNQLKNRFNIVSSFDDSDTNVKMFRDEGITSFHLVR